MKKLLEKLDQKLLILGVVLCFSGIIYRPLTAIGCVLLFLWLIVVIFMQLPVVVRDSIRDSAQKKRAVAYEAERRQRIRQSTDPETLSVTLENRQDQGMSSAALLFVEVDSRRVLTLNHDDYVKVYNHDGSVLFEGFMNLNPPVPWYKAKLFSGPHRNTQHSHKNWRNWFYEKPALKADLTRYEY